MTEHASIATVHDVDPAAWVPRPIDLADLFRRARGITADGTPAVAALCARLSSYVTALHGVPRHAELDAWITREYDRWCQSLAQSKDGAVEATLRTDPANLILGAEALPDAALASRSLQEQFAVYHRAAQRGVQPLTRANRAIVRAILGPHSPFVSSDVLRDPLPLVELSRQLTPTACATLALASRWGNVPTELIPTENEITAVALRSVWTRDLSGVGLTLLASTFLFGQAVPAGLVPWIARVTRRDGFVGMWDFYADCQPKAALLATVNVYWGLSARADNQRRAVRVASEPRSQRSPSLSRRCRKAIERAQSWLDAHHHRFGLLPACRDSDDYQRRFKPFVELALLTHVLTREHHRRAKARWVGWAERTAERLWPHAEWEGLIESFRLHTASTLGLAIYPFLMSALGRTSPFAAEAKALLESSFAQAQERTPMREMDYQFTRRCMGAEMSTDVVREQIERSVLRREFDPLLIDTDALYDLTHVVFYATRFGCDPWRAPRESVDCWLAGVLAPMTLARFLMDDCDLGAELLLVHFYTGRPLDPCTADCVERLLAGQLTTGAFRGPSDSKDERDEFDANYHTTLVAIAALAEADLRAGSI